MSIFEAEEMEAEEREAREIEATFFVVSGAWFEKQRGGPLTGMLVYLSRCPYTGEPTVANVVDPNDVRRQRTIFERLYNQGGLFRVGVVQPSIEPLPSETTEGSQPASPE